MTTAAQPFAWGSRTLLMGIINVTPDSFSGDGVYLDPARAAARARALQAEGADCIDLGGESTRPGHAPIALDEELRRVLPSLEAVLAVVTVPVSIDTRKAAVARAALDLGASVVNDISGLLADPAMADEAAGADGVVLMAGAMPNASQQADVVQRVHNDWRRALQAAQDAGVPRERLILDPGFGFGKRWFENLELLRRLRELQTNGLPLLAGLSRKSTIARVLGDEPAYRAEANATLTALAIAGGAQMVRVHDVAGMAAVCRLADAVLRGVDGSEVE
jgi:dihydropteroate synthase